MACPMGYGVRFEGGHMATMPESDEEDQKNNGEVPKPALSQDGVYKAAVFSDQISYSDYLRLDKLLDCQELRSKEANRIVPDEHLFIVVHQTYELWFKQIIFDIDQVRLLLHNKYVDETKTLQIVSLLERTAKILKLLVDQILILETMSPLDFVEFRRYLTSASGFQSLQFRLLENKLGVITENRVRYNAQHYKEVFSDNNEMQKLVDSEEEPSLFTLIDRWLSRTPGLEGLEELEGDDQEVEEPFVVDGADKLGNGAMMDHLTVLRSTHNSGDDEHSTVAKKRKNFWNRYLEAVGNYLEDMRMQAEEENLSKEEKTLKRDEYIKTKKSFDTITDEAEYQLFLDKRERRLSHNALKGALMIYFYRDMPRFSQPYQILFNLMDIDSLLQKWRYNHVMLVQRMLGSRQGSGGSSGYLYLRSTVSDRYKVFLDLFNLSTWLIPRMYIPKLSPKMVKTLSEHSNLSNH